MNRLYFAYGSNLCLPRLRYRVPGVREVGPGCLDGYALRWHKRGSDGSGKCSIEKCGADETEMTDRVHGALFEVPAEERPALDRIEGLGVGYREATVEVLPTGPRGALPATGERGRSAHEERGRVRAWTYVATDTHIDEGLRPFRWYRELVLAGATALGFPASYLERIRAVSALADPDDRRAARNRRFLHPRSSGRGPPHAGAERDPARGWPGPGAS